MGGIGVQAHLGDGVVLADAAVGPREGIEVVDLDGVEAIGRAPGDPAADDARRAASRFAAVVGSSIISSQSRSITTLPSASRSSRSGWFARHHASSPGWIWNPLT